MAHSLNPSKTTISQQLKQDLPNSVFLDGDWCWDSNPFHVTEETKVMHQQKIIDTIVKNLDIQNCAVKCISLIADEKHLYERLMTDVKRGIRTQDVIERSVERIPLYHNLNTIKIDTDNKAVQEIVDDIRGL